MSGPKSRERRATWGKGYPTSGRALRGVLEPGMTFQTRQGGPLPGALSSGVWVIAPQTADVESWHPWDEGNTNSLEDVLAT